MRNLKKVLALVLAMAMSLSLAVSAGAAFNDQDKIVNTEAVDMCVALNVINGRTDGSFDPAGNVTRAEMAKMICIVLNGGKEPTTATKATPTFADIDGHWAEGYIEYCFAKGVIAGKSATQFDPNGSVTGTEAAKMLLVALGYNADVEKMVGANWALYTNVLANQTGLYEDLESMDPGVALNRDNAAQMIWNTLQALEIIRSSSIDREDGSINDSYLPGQDSLLEAKYGAQSYVGTFVADYNTNSSLDDGYITVNGKLDTATSEDTTDASFAYDLDLSLIGEEVQVVFKDGKAGTEDKPDSKDTIYGVFVTGETDVVNTTCADIEDVTSDAAKVKINGTEYKQADSISVVTNYVTGSAESVSDLYAAVAASTGDAVKVILNSDGKVASAYVVKSSLAYVTAVNSEKVTVSGIGALEIADNDVYEGVAKNDIVVVTTLYNASAAHEDAVTVIEKAEVVSGTVEGFKGTESVTVDGTVYSIYNETTMPASIAGESATPSFDTTAIGETFDLYLVNGFVAAAIQTSESASNYSVVIDTNGGVAGNKWNPLKVVVMDAAGNETTLIADKDGASPVIGDIITYTGSADAAEIVVEAAWGSDSEVASAGDKLYNKTTKSFASEVTSADCVLFVKTTTGTVDADATYKAYAIRDLNDLVLSANARYSYVMDDDKVVAAFINLGDTPAGATTTTVYGIVTADNGTVKIGDDYYVNYTVYTTAGEKQVNLDGATLTVGNIYKFDPATDNCYKAGDIVAHGGQVAAIEDYNEADGLLSYYTTRTGTAPDCTFGGLTTKAVAEDVVVLYVDADKDVAGAEIGISAYDEITDLYNAIIIVDTDDADVIEYIIVETSNKCDIG